MADDADEASGFLHADDLLQGPRQMPQERPKKHIPFEWDGKFAHGGGGGCGKVSFMKRLPFRKSKSHVLAAGRTASTFSSGGISTGLTRW